MRILMKSLLSIASLLAFVAAASAHYTFPSLVVNGTTTTAWVNVRETNNHYSREPVMAVNSTDFRCYNSQNLGNATTINVTAGSKLGIMSDGTIYHPGVVNVYMAKANGSVSNFTGDGKVWFKVYQITAETNGGKSITFPAQNLPGVNFTVPTALPSGEYLVRMEALALHDAADFGGAQWYISCGQIVVTGGGNGSPGPLVAIPGVYTGYEPGIMLNIYYPIPTNYTQPGPAVWSG